MKDRRKTLQFALMKTLPIAVSYFFVAVAFGMLMTQAGYPLPWSLFTSVWVYSGAFQFVLVSFLAAGAPLLTISLTALFMSSRHIFYGLSFLQEFRRAGKAFPYLIFGLTDEVYSLFCSLEYPPEVDQPRAMFEIALFSQLYWILGSVAGAAAGSLLPANVKGIDFCLTALIVTIVLDQWKTAASRRPALIGFACALVCLMLLGASRFILPAMMLAAGLLLLDARFHKEVSHEA